jgi:hypothetical protein
MVAIDRPNRAEHFLLYMFQEKIGTFSQMCNKHEKFKPRPPPNHYQILHRYAPIHCAHADQVWV